MGMMSPFATIMSCSFVILRYKLKSIGKGVMWSLALESRIQSAWDTGPIVLNVLLPFMGRVYDLEDLVIDSIIVLKW